MRYSETFKQKAVNRLIEDGSKRYLMESKRIGVHNVTLRKWYLKNKELRSGHRSWTNTEKIRIVQWVAKNPSIDHTDASILIGVSEYVVGAWFKKWASKKEKALRVEYKTRFDRYKKTKQQKGEKGRTCKDCFFGSTYCNRLKLKLQDEMVMEHKAISIAERHYSPNKTCSGWGRKDFLP